MFSTVSKKIKFLWATFGIYRQQRYEMQIKISREVLDIKRLQTDRQIRPSPLFVQSMHFAPTSFNSFPQSTALRNISKESNLLPREADRQAQTQASIDCLNLQRGTT